MASCRLPDDSVWARTIMSVRVNQGTAVPPGETFDMRNDQHLARLARLMHKAEENKDEQLFQIVRYFFTTL